MIVIGGGGGLLVNPRLFYVVFAFLSHIFSLSALIHANLFSFYLHQAVSIASGSPNFGKFLASLNFHVLEKFAAPLPIIHFEKLIFYAFLI